MLIYLFLLFLLVTDSSTKAWHFVYSPNLNNDQACTEEEFIYFNVCRITHFYSKIDFWQNKTKKQYLGPKNL